MRSTFAGTWTRVGFAASRSADTAASEKTLLSALQSGLTLVETNAANEASERTVGNALREFGAERGGAGAVQEAVAVVSKLGWDHVEGSAEPQLHAPDATVMPLQTTAFGEPEPGSGSGSNATGGASMLHSIHPDFIRAQLNSCLDRLGRNSIELAMVHQPEFFAVRQLRLDEDPIAVAAAAASLPDRLEVLRELDQRLFECFVALELEVAAGRIGGYGVSSHAIALGPSEAGVAEGGGALPYKHWPELARKARLEAQRRSSGNGNGTVSGTNDSGDSGLAAIQFPCNLLEPWGVLPGGAGPWARAQGMRVLASRPLTGVMDGAAHKLVAQMTMAAEDSASTPAQRAAMIEQVTHEFHGAVTANVLEHFTPPPGAEPPLQEACGLIRDMVSDLDRALAAGVFTDYQAYEAHLMNGAIPLLTERIGSIDEDSNALLQSFFSGMGALVQQRCEHHVLSLIESDRCPSGAHDLTSNASEPLHQYALQWAAQQTCVSNVLVGMTKPEHAQDALSMLAKLPPSDE